MAPLPPDTTGRIYVDYVVGGEGHTITARYPSTGDAVTALSTMAEVFAFLDGALYETTIEGARFSVAGSNVTNPITWPGDPSYGTGSPPAGQQMKFISWVGKSPDGRRTRWEVFGISASIPSTWRLAQGINTSIDNARGHVADAGAEESWCGISGLPYLVNPYTNFKYADHEIAKVRGS